MAKNVSDVVAEDKVSILIVDDEPSVGDALKLVLESNGYEVVLVNNGLDGIDQARKRRFGFSVVDLFLADISGFQVIADIRQLQPHIPIVLITAHGGPQVFDEAKKLGACAALAKPFPPAEILKIIAAKVGGPTDASS
jgi:DNA-binding NtrC family response regulator